MSNERFNLTLAQIEAMNQTGGTVDGLAQRSSLTLPSSPARDLARCVMVQAGCHGLATRRAAKRVRGRAKRACRCATVPKALRK